MNITTRDYHEEDAPFLAAIYFNTIHHVNIKDYSQVQVDAWAPQNTLETASWIQKWHRIKPIVALLNEKIVGFVELEDNGHIDCFYCHHEHQGCGIGRILMQAAETKAKNISVQKIFAEISITARPFFEAMGFKIVKAQQVTIRDVVFDNFLMEKYLF